MIHPACNAILLDENSAEIAAALVYRECVENCACNLHKFSVVLPRLVIISVDKFVIPCTFIYVFKGN